MYECFTENAVNLKNKLITFKLRQSYIYMLHFQQNIKFTFKLQT